MKRRILSMVLGIPFLLINTSAESSFTNWEIKAKIMTPRVCVWNSLIAVEESTQRAAFRLLILLRRRLRCHISCTCDGTFFFLRSRIRFCGKFMLRLTFASPRRVPSSFVRLHYVHKTLQLFAETVSKHCSWVNAKFIAALICRGRRELIIALCDCQCR